MAALHAMGGIKWLLVLVLGPLKACMNYEAVCLPDVLPTCLGLGGRDSGYKMASSCLSWILAPRAEAADPALAGLYPYLSKAVPYLTCGLMLSSMGAGCPPNPKPSLNPKP